VRLALEAELLEAARYAVTGIPVRKLAPDSALARSMFTIINPRAADAALREASRLVIEVTGETRRAITAIIARMTRGQITVTQGAQELRQIVGLTTQQANAVYNFRRTLEARAGLVEDRLAAQRALTDQQRGLLAHRLANTQARIDALSERYEARLLRQRTEMIARTESMRAANRGQQEAWLAARDQGLLSSEQVQVWLVTPDERLCPYCAPMEDRVALLGQPFTHPETGEQFLGPPIHPHCRCSQSLRITEPELTAAERSLAADFRITVR